MKIKTKKPLIHERFEEVVGILLNALQYSCDSNQEKMLVLSEVKSRVDFEYKTELANSLIKKVVERQRFFDKLSQDAKKELEKRK